MQPFPKWESNLRLEKWRIKIHPPFHVLSIIFPHSVPVEGHSWNWKRKEKKKTQNTLTAKPLVCAKNSKGWNDFASKGTQPGPEEDGGTLPIATSDTLHVIFPYRSLLPPLSLPYVYTAALNLL